MDVKLTFSTQVLRSTLVHPTDLEPDSDHRVSVKDRVA